MSSGDQNDVQVTVNKTNEAEALKPTKKRANVSCVLLDLVKFIQHL